MSMPSTRFRRCAQVIEARGSAGVLVGEKKAESDRGRLRLITGASRQLRDETPTGLRFGLRRGDAISDRGLRGGLVHRRGSTPQHLHHPSENSRQRPRRGSRAT